MYFGPVVKRLRHRPFTAVTRVRFPSGSVHTGRELITNQQLGVNMSMRLNLIRLTVSIAGRELITNQKLEMNMPMRLNLIRLTVSIAGRALITNQKLEMNMPMWLNWQSS